MSLPSWIQIWHPQLKTPGPWDPTLMQCFAAERGAHPSTLHSLDPPEVRSIPPPPPPPTDASPLPLLPPQSAIGIVQMAGIDLEKNDVEDLEDHEPTASDHNDGGNDEDRSSDSGSEMSLSSLDNAPIIHSSDNVNKSLDSSTSDNIHIDTQIISSALQCPPSHVKSQPQPVFISTPRTDLVSHSTTSPDTQTDIHPLTKYLNITSPLEELNDSIWDTMTKPPTPSTLRNSWTASQLQAQADTIDVPVVTNATRARSILAAVFPDLAIDFGNVNSLTTASKTDDTSSTLPKISETTRLPSSLTGASAFARDSNTHRQDPDSPARATPFPQAQNTASAQTPTPQSFEIPSNPLHNLPPIYQAAWRQANLSLRRGITDTDEAAQRQADQRRDRAYHEGIEAAKPFFKKGVVDCMINGSSVMENTDGAGGDRSAWEEVYRLGYKPGEGGQ